ncbi:MAG: NAD-dependent epimerase/dehydratase family protein [Candidatus Dormibacteria bacterium]
MGQFTGLQTMIGILGNVAQGRVLITGGAGFIGAHTAVKLLRAGYSVRVLDALLPPVHTEKQRPRWLDPQVELVIGDVRNHDDVSRALKDVDAVVHLAAYQDYLPDFSTFFHVNTVGTAMIYEVAVAQKLPLRKVVVASSQATYGEAAYHCVEHGRVMPPLRDESRLRAGNWEVVCPTCGQGLQVIETNESAVNPHNQYAVSKYTQELVAFNLGRRYDIPTTCLRYSIVQGPWQSFRNAYSGICRIFTMRVLNGGRPVAFEDGGQLRDYVWVGDVAAANHLVMEDARSDYRSFNVGGLERHTVLEYGAEVARVLGRPGLQPETPGLYRFGDTRHVVSSSAALRALGWEQTLRVPEIIERYAEWARGEADARDNLDASLARMLELGTVRKVSA